MRVLIVGSGVIGTVYGAHLAAGGHAVSVLSHPPRTDQVAADGLRARDVLGGRCVQAPVSVVPDASAGQYDLVLVAVRADQLKAACAQLTDLTGDPRVILFGNNPGGRSTVGDLAGELRQGFPGVGGVLHDGVAEYVRIPHQPTSLEAASDPWLGALEQALGSSGFPVHRIEDMDGWLLYHAAFVACVAAALFRCGVDPGLLAADPATLSLMCAAITEAFAALHHAGVAGLPGNLAVLHHPLLRPAATRYWARVMRSPMGELCFAAHCRHAEAEMRVLGDEVTTRLGDAPRTGHLRRLLEPAQRWRAPEAGIRARGLRPATPRGRRDARPGR
jgi:2-dehydropantoate 2-reductase